MRLDVRFFTEATVATICNGKAEEEVENHVAGNMLGYLCGDRSKAQ